ncbi:DNA topoisomerase 3-alpha-like [Solanum pennellii]|uniref:DNA topoisomerase 3-alpha-like n=1 Tax=Solanum pennellii TaxID=28526 RepID=A0ABM1GA98_SOLPN|nr:DNA topoisomerase 3-alpha-like [Solanum pennellii]
MADFEDEEFLSQVAAAEAEALSTAAKRRRISATVTTTTTTTAVTTPKFKVNVNNNASVEEGAYLAVLKGNTSVLFQQKVSTNAGGSCFKRGKSGHWARDCDTNPPTDDSVSFPEKICACGMGSCLVLTANTEKNRGRKFYRCPMRQENGGCGFFQWCDQPPVTDSLTTRGPSYSVSSTFPELSCPCGSGTCLVLTAKTGKNIGQQFYRCPLYQGGCGFFKWCNDNTTNASFSNSSNSSQSLQSTNKINNTVVSSFKCGNAGHWVKDCPQSSSQRSAADGGVQYSNSRTCFKCGKPGCWAKECSSN